MNRDQRLPARRRVDAVQVELPVDVRVVAAEIDRLRVAERARRCDGHAVEHRLLRVGEVRGRLRDHDVVDERRRRAQGVRADERTRARVVDGRGARPRPGDEEPVAAVELDPGGRLAGSSGDEDRAVAGAEVATVDRAVPDGPRVERGSPADLDALRPEAGRQLDQVGKRPLLRRGRRARAEDCDGGQQRTDRRDDAKHACPPV